MKFIKKWIKKIFIWINATDYECAYISYNDHLTDSNARLSLIITDNQYNIENYLFKTNTRPKLTPDPSPGVTFWS